VMRGRSRSTIMCRYRARRFGCKASFQDLDTVDIHPQRQVKKYLRVGRSDAALLDLLNVKDFHAPPPPPLDDTLSADIERIAGDGEAPDAGDQGSCRADEDGWIMDIGHLERVVVDGQIGESVDNLHVFDVWLRLFIAAEQSRTHGIGDIQNIERYAPLFR